MIIVGLDNGGESRADEYTPTHDAEKKAGGRADDHARMLIEELKPIIDQRYRTSGNRASTAAGGSSLGGLLSLHLGLKYPHIFGGIAAMSPSVWWDKQIVLGEVDQFSAEEKPRIWLDIGGREGLEALAGSRALRDRLRARGWTDEHLGYYEDRRGEHNERAWASRARMMLEFLFPPKP